MATAKISIASMLRKTIKRNARKGRIMKTIKAKGLSFVQTHETEPERYDVRDSDWKRVAYVEFDNGHLMCTTSDEDGTIVYSADVDRPRPYLHFVADAVNEYIASCGTPNDTQNTAPPKKKPMKAKVWKVFGYKGNDDCDGPADYNFHFEVLMDARFSKEDVQDIFANRFSKKYRSVEVGAEELREIEV
jgi:hypothetical protein